MLLLPLIIPLMSLGAFWGGFLRKRAGRSLHGEFWAWRVSFGVTGEGTASPEDGPQLFLLPAKSQHIPIAHPTVSSPSPHPYLEDSKGIVLKVSLIFTPLPSYFCQARALNPPFYTRSKLLPSNVLEDPKIQRFPSALCSS